MTKQTCNVTPSFSPPAKTTRVAIFADRQQTYDLDQIYSYAAGRYSVRLFDGGGPDEVLELLKWSNICWFEGLGSLLLTASHMPKACRNIVRLDDNEIRSDLAAKVNWHNIDVLIADDPETARRCGPAIGEATAVIRIDRRGGIETKGARIGVLFHELEKKPFHYNRETGRCRDKLAPYCRGKGIDVGCGDNKILPSAIGIDIADMANEVIADARSLPFENGSADYVFSSHCLEDLDDTGGALAEWMRVLRPGGNLVLYLPHKNYYPRVDTAGANPAHKHDLDPDFVLAALSETNDYEILYLDEPQNDGEYSFSLVVRKLHQELPARKIIVECHAAVGDVVCAEPAIRALRRKLGDNTAIILRVTHPGLFRNHPDVDRVENTLFPSRCSCVEQKYELSIKPTKANRRCHLVDRAAEQIGVELDDRAPRIFLDRWDEKMLEKFNLSDTDGPKIAISPYVNWPSRLWEGTNWAQLCAILRDRFNATMIQLGAAGTYHARLGIDLVGRTSVREAAAVLTKCDLLVSVDTGLAHLAAAVGTPTVGIFGPIYPELRMHQGLGRAVIAAEAECRGCFHWYEGDVRQCPKGHHECMKLISVEAVLNAVCGVLGFGKCA